MVKYIILLLALSLTQTINYAIGYDACYNVVSSVRKVSLISAILEKVALLLSDTSNPLAYFLCF